MRVPKFSKPISSSLLRTPRLRVRMIKAILKEVTERKMAVSSLASMVGIPKQLPFFSRKHICGNFNMSMNINNKNGVLQNSYSVTVRSFSLMMSSETNRQQKPKQVWIWTGSKQVMMVAVERGWNTFLFSAQHRQLASDWSCKLINLLTLSVHVSYVKFFLHLLPGRMLTFFVSSHMLLHAEWRRIHT